MTGRRGRHNIFKVTGKVVVFSLRQPPRHKQRRTLQEMWFFASCWQEILRLHCLCLLLPFALEVQQIPYPSAVSWPPHWLHLYLQSFGNMGL